MWRRQLQPLRSGGKSLFHLGRLFKIRVGNNLAYRKIIARWDDLLVCAKAQDTLLIPTPKIPLLTPCNFIDVDDTGTRFILNHTLF